MEELETKRTRREVIEEHVTVLAEPGIGYLGHFSLSPSQVRKIVIPEIQRNAFGAHHESILAAMVSSTNLNHSELAWRRILRSREHSVFDGRIKTTASP